MRNQLLGILFSGRCSSLAVPLTCSRSHLRLQESMAMRNRLLEKMLPGQQQDAMPVAPSVVLGEDCRELHPNMRAAGVRAQMWTFRQLRSTSWAWLVCLQQLG